MNSKQIQNIEPNGQQTISTYSTTYNNAQNIENLDHSQLVNNNQQIIQVVSETRKIIQNNNGSKTIEEIQEQKYQINSIPFKSLMKDDNKMDIEQKSAFSSGHLTTNNILFNNNPFNPKSLNSLDNNNSNNMNNSNIINEFNHQTINNSNNLKKNNSQIPRSSMNSFPQERKMFESKVFKIQTYKSHQKGRMTYANFFNNNCVLDLPKINEENGNYKILIKRIANQLKRKIRIPTKGFFYQYITKENERYNQYKLLVKRLALQLKRRTRTPKHGFFSKYIKSVEYQLLVKRIAIQLKRKKRAPTHGYFYKYIKNVQYQLLIKRIAIQLKRKKRAPTHGYFYKYIKNEQYKLLIHRIAFQLKRRKKFPTCKIIKIYESYCKLIKRIAHQLKISRQKRMPTIITNKAVIIEETKVNNGNTNNEINNNKNIISEKKIFNNNLNQKNITTISEINKNEIIQTTLNKSSNINNNLEKIDIEEEEKPEIYENQKVFTFKNIENNINNDINNMHMDIEDNKKENIKINGDNFSFSQGSDKNEQTLNEDNKKENILLSEKNESKKLLTNRINPILYNKSEAKTNKVIEILKDGKISQSYPSSRKGGKRSVNINLSLFKKENNNKDNKLKLFQNNTYKKESNIINYMNNINGDIDQDLNTSQDLNVSLSNFEVSKSNFIHDFHNFLNKVNIQIVNNFPVSLSEKNKHYFQQSNFWILIMNYLFFQNNNISLYTITSLLEQYIIWCNDINIENFTILKDRIKEYINSNYSSEKISQFLFMNKLKNIEEIFDKYEINIKNKNKNINYKEMKIDNLNLSNNEELKCNCKLCRDDEACIKKVMEINNKRININKDINLNYISEKELLPQYNKSINNITNNEEFFVKGISKKNKNIFTKSKTIATENTHLEYKLFNHNITQNFDEIIEDDDNKKNYKNISKKKNKNKKNEEKEEEEKEEEKNDSENEANKEKIKEKEVLEKKEKKENDDNKEKDESDSENKNKKKIKKTKKGKSRSRNKKKRDSPKSDKNEIEDEEKEENDNNEEKEEEKSKSKSRSKKKKKKNKNSDKIEKYDSDEKDEKVEYKEDEEDIINTYNSKRKKSKTPNKKRNKKH